MDRWHSIRLQEDINNGVHWKVGDKGGHFCQHCGWEIRGIVYNMLDRHYCEQCYIPIFNMVNVGGSLNVEEYNLLIEKIDGLTDLLIKLVKELGKK